MREALIGVINGFFNEDPPANPLAIAAFRRAAESLLVAPAESFTEALPPEVSPGSARVLVQALDLIDHRARDPEFSVAQLAAELSVSQAHLHAVFSQTGMSVGKYLRRARAVVAQRYLESAPEKRDLDEIAARSGFSSVRTMTRALESLKPQL